LDTIPSFHQHARKTHLRDLQIQYSKETGHLFKITGKLPDDETTKTAAWEISLALLDYEMPEDNEF
jgi:hypothetical protein